MQIIIPERQNSHLCASADRWRKFNQSGAREKQTKGKKRKELKGREIKKNRPSQQVFERKRSQRKQKLSTETSGQGRRR